MLIHSTEKMGKKNLRFFFSGKSCNKRQLKDPKILKVFSNLNDPMILPTDDVKHREVVNAPVPGTDTEALAAQGAVT